MNKTPLLITSLVSSIAPKLIRHASTPSSSTFAVRDRIYSIFLSNFPFKS
jgi:hypothetical protein